MAAEGDVESFVGVPAGIGGAGKALKFAALFHTGHGASHYDFLLEIPGKERLMTWHLQMGPEEWAGALPAQLGAERIQGHRLTYMMYEGPVLGGRGEVKRVAAGTATVVKETTALVKLHLMGEGMDCEMTLPL